VVFVIFDDKESFDKSREILHAVNYPVTYLSGSRPGLEGFVQVIAKPTLKEFDERNIRYTVIDRENVSGYLSERGEQYLKGLESHSPHLLSTATDRKIDPNRKTICFYVADEREYEAQALLEDLGYDCELRDVIRGRVTPDRKGDKVCEMVEFKAIVDKQHIDDIVASLAENKLCAYSRETQVLVSDAYEDKS